MDTHTHTHTHIHTHTHVCTRVHMQGLGNRGGSRILRKGGRKTRYRLQACNIHQNVIRIMRQSPELICVAHVFLPFFSDDVIKYARSQYNKMADSQL